MPRVIVTFELKEEAVEGFKQILQRSTPKTLADKGCLCAGMYQDAQHPTKFRCIEDWETYEDMMNHINAPKDPNDPDDAFPYIQANMIGKDEFQYFNEFVVMHKGDAPAR